MIWIDQIESDVADCCNLACSECSRYMAHVREHSFYPLEQFIEDITIAGKVIKSRCFKITGGEPLLNPNLSAYAVAAKQSGISKNIWLMTNGLLLTKQDPDLLRLFERIIISKYSSIDVSDGLKYAQQYTLAIMNPKPTHWKMFVTSPQPNYEMIFNQCRMKTRCNAIYRGRFYRCMISNKKIQLFNKLNIKHDLDVSTFSINLHDDNIEQRIKDYLNSGPMPPCKWCLGTSGETIPHATTPAP